MSSKKHEIAIPEELLFKKILLIRGHKVMLNSDLAELYGVETKVLNQAVKRNIHRFPGDFMFKLNKKEWQELKKQTQPASVPGSLRSQIVTSNRGGTRYAPLVFTEQGVAMLSSVLNSAQAVDVNIQIMRIFVKMRQMIAGYADLLKKIEALEIAQTANSDEISNIYKVIKELLQPEYKDRRPIGFKLPTKKIN